MTLVTQVIDSSGKVVKEETRTVRIPARSTITYVTELEDEYEDYEVNTVVYEADKVLDSVTTSVSASKTISGQVIDNTAEQAKTDYLAFVLPIAIVFILAGKIL